MLRKTRIAAAAVIFAALTLLFLDFTGTLHRWLDWLAGIQFIPAVLSVHLVTVALLVTLTLVFGRIYCSVICPLGIMQDIISWAHGKTARKNRFRFSWSPARNVLRYTMLGLFIASIIAGLTSLASLIEPYSAFGRIVSNLFGPLYQWGNNALALVAERADSYAFYSTDVWMKGLSALITAAVTLAVIFILSWKNGRTYCNTICPVGTILGLLSRFSLFRIMIDTGKCRECGLCARRCKASCINMKEGKVDHSRCVDCFDCLDACSEGAVIYVPVWKKSGDNASGSRGKVSSASGNAGSSDIRDNGRRAFITSAAVAVSAATIKAQEMKLDGGLAEIQDKKVPARKTPLKPAGSQSFRHFTQHCTACQLCVTVCPQQVLRPSSSLLTFMQPEMSFERGWCRPECTKCSEVCPSGPIRPVTQAEKSSIQIGHAVVIYENCVVNTDGVSCGNCARHCPSGAIQMVHSVPGDRESLRIPVVNPERCIGCGACENLCPARPFSAIYVEGHEVHRTI
ncbi:MAG TPA: 4Fe-4S dicluster domain-containing protein [Candidatus Cryptobacteroides intestinipullorum]|nr:4Fe-4S dicluster domain-containing protein [Candidatus Cryptobacteroides intestinipullorum]